MFCNQESHLTTYGAQPADATFRASFMLISIFHSAIVDRSLVNIESLWRT